MNKMSTKLCTLSGNNLHKPNNPMNKMSIKLCTLSGNNLHKPVTETVIHRKRAKSYDRLMDSEKVWTFR